MTDLIAISALIADRSYRIKISPSDEEVVRRTLKTINDKIIEYKTQFAGKDMQDYIAMVLIWYATEQQDQQKLDIENSSIDEHLTYIENLLDNSIGK
jgi:cell division protein ZapA